VIEFLIIVVGFFLSLQINDWKNGQDDLLLEQEYLVRLQDDYTESERVINEDISTLSSNLKDLSAGLELLHEIRQPITAQDQASFQKALSAVPSIGGFGVLFGTLEELKDTGNMRLIRSQELRKALGNLNQKYQQTLRVTELRNILRGHAFPIIIKYLVEGKKQQMILNNELSNDDYRELYSAMIIIQTNQNLDLMDSQNLAASIREILKNIGSQIDNK
jgi:hypothetical protein